MDVPIWIISAGNICKICQHGKDRYKEACFCDLYGVMVSYGKTKCKGFCCYSKKNKESEDEESE